MNSGKINTVYIYFIKKSSRHDKIEPMSRKF